MTKGKKNRSTRKEKIDTQGMGSKGFHPEWQFYKIAPDPSQFPAMPRVSYGMHDPLPRSS